MFTVIIHSQDGKKETKFVVNKWSKVLGLLRSAYGFMIITSVDIKVNQIEMGEKK